jgi:hypothetical protein
VRRVRDDDAAPPPALASILEVGAHEHQSCDLALRACRGLERNRVQTADLRENLLQPPLELERSLGPLLLLQWMQVAEARQRCDPLVHPGVVLHRAGAERIETAVDAERAHGELREMTEELRLGHLGQARRRSPAQLVGNLRNGQAVTG